MQLTMLKESFFCLRSYKYEHFKRNFFCGTNIEGGVEDIAFPVFGFCQDHSNCGLTYNFDIQFDATIPGDYFRRQLRLNRNTFSVLIEYSSPAPDKTKHALA